MVDHSKLLAEKNTERYPCIFKDEKFWVYRTGAGEYQIKYFEDGTQIGENYISFKNRDELIDIKCEEYSNQIAAKKVSFSGTVQDSDSAVNSFLSKRLGLAYIASFFEDLKKNGELFN